MGCSSSSEVVEPQNRPTTRPAAPAPAPTSRAVAAPAKKATPKYKLTYFDFEGRGELIRLIFVAGGLEFVDVRINKETEWPDKKSETPLGQVPVLEVSGSKVPLVQSVAIARFVANEAGLAGKTSVDKAKADAVVDTVNELLEAFIAKIWFGITEETPNKEAIMENFGKNEIEKIMQNLSRLLKAFGSDGYFVGDQLSWADVYVYQVVSILNLKFDGFLSAYPELAKNRQQVESNERIKQYLAKRDQKAQAAKTD